MFCYQCEQTTRTENGNGCASQRGVCGKEETTSDLQDLLIHGLKGIAQYVVRARKLGVSIRECDDFLLYGLFTTLTNVNFNNTRFVTLIQKAATLKDHIKTAYEQAATSKNIAIEMPKGAAQWQPAFDLEGLLAQAALVPITFEKEQVGEDIIGLRALLLYGLKGVAAYAHHANVLGYHSDIIFEQIAHTLDFLADQPTNLEKLVEEAMHLGSLNLKVMELLDAANIGRFGTPEPTQVRITPKAGKCILVSGHDLGDLEALLEQTKDTGIQIYTHGEMLPAHSYPKLKAYPHLVGNYGGAWQDQQREFAEFPGAILMTSNCLIEPNAKYRQRIFTAGPVGWSGLRHIENHQFGLLIQAAKALPGFREDSPEEKLITIGFGRDAILGVADKVIDAVKTGDIRHFFLVGGCDGAASGRNYYTDFALQAPADTVILTLGCNKYRFNKHDFGAIGGIPRLLDLGQCNDSYSAIKVAVALSEAFQCSVNELPLSLIVSWFEQKAAAVLLTLLSLGLKNIRLGPTLPAFITPGVLDYLVRTFEIKPITTAEADLTAILKKAA